MSEDKNFLSRWSERKLRRRHEEEAEAEAARAAEAPALAEPAAGPGEFPAEEQVGERQAVEPVPQDTGQAGPAEPAAPERHPAEDIDIDALTKESDFTIFMQKGVPSEVKRRALRKLWTSDPVLANLDGLNDYEDMERVYGIGPIGETGWKVGRGFLTDADLGLVAEAGEEGAPDGEEADRAEAAADLATGEDASAAADTSDPERHGEAADDEPRGAEAEIAEAESAEAETAGAEEAETAGADKVPGDDTRDHGRG